MLRMKKIIATCAEVRVCGRVAITFLFYTIMTMFYGAFGLRGECDADLFVGVDSDPKLGEDLSLL